MKTIPTFSSAQGWGGGCSTLPQRMVTPGLYIMSCRRSYMIKFACHCNHVFELPEEMAGRQVQCPNCQRLVDVPTHNELAELSDDGTFRLDAPVAAPSGHFEEMRRVFAKEKVDENGMPIDLRQTREELAAAGTEAEIFEFDEHPTAPKYDPETGELIRPLDIVEDPAIARNPSQCPMAPERLELRRARSLQESFEYSPLARMVTPINLAAMFFVLLFHLFFLLAAFSLYPHHHGAYFSSGPLWWHITPTWLKRSASKSATNSRDSSAISISSTTSGIRLPTFSWPG